MTGTPIDLDKMRSIGVISRRSDNRVQEGRDGDGKRYKATTDDVGNTITQRADDRQDVTIRAPKITMRASQTEER